MASAPGRNSRTWCASTPRCREIPPTPEELWLFPQFHFRQVFLAGLPLAFLPPQLRQWVWRPLIDLWDRTTYIHAAYDRVADVLGLYREAFCSRRDADRRRK